MSEEIWELDDEPMTEADLDRAKEELVWVLSQRPQIAEGLKAEIERGNVNGNSTHSCILAWIGRLSGIKAPGAYGATVEWVGEAFPKKCSRLEYMAFRMKFGSTPQNNRYSKLLVDWIDEITGVVNA